MWTHKFAEFMKHHFDTGANPYHRFYTGYFFSVRLNTVLPGKLILFTGDYDAMLRCSTFFPWFVLLSLNLAHAGDKEGFTTIFNGKNLSGWDGDNRLWSVKDGVIHGETTAELKSNGNTFLIWEGGTTEDFELRLKFRCNATNNSGIQYRSKRISENIPNQWVVRGYQHEIRNQNILPNVSGFIYDEGGLAGGRSRTCLVGEKAVWGKAGKRITETLITADEYKTLFQLDTWNEVVIRCRGNHIQHFTNGKLVMDFVDGHKKALFSGVLALQLHAGPPMWAEFKEIRIKNIK